MSKVAIALFMFIYLTSICALVLSEVMHHAGILPKPYVILRLSVFVGFSALVGTFLISRLTRPVYYVNSLFAPTVFLVLLVTSIYYYLFEFASRDLTVAAIFLSSVYIVFYTNRRFRLFENRVIVVASLIFAFGAAATLTLGSRALNAESYPSVSHSKTLPLLPFTPTEHPRVVLPLSDSEYQLVEGNIGLADVKKLKYRPPFVELDKRLGLVVEGLSSRLSVVCLLGIYRPGFGTYDDIADCFEDSTRLERFSERGALSLLDKVSFGVTEDKVAVLYSLYADTRHSKVSADVKEQIYGSVGSVFVAGGYFHHYHSLTRSLVDGDLIFDNQYGLGPVLLVYITALVSGFPPFDALYLSVIISTFIVFIAVLFVARRSRSHLATGLIYTGFGLSLLMCFTGSNLMAPMLYANRFLPSILILLFVYSRWLSGVRNSDIPPLLLLALSVYNFEYAILTLLGLAVADGLKDKRRVVIYALFALLAIFTKFAFREAGVSAVNYKYYLAGYGLPDFPNFLVLLYCGLAILLALSLRVSPFSSDLAFRRIVAVGLLLSLKFVWNGAFNHIGFLALTFFLGVGIILQSCYRSLLGRLVVSYTVVLIALSFGVAGITMNSFSLNQNFNNREYVRTHFSRIFEVDKALIEVGDELKELTSGGEDGLLISPKDTFLMIYLQRHLTGPLPDLSTNLVTNMDYKSIAHYIEKSDVKRIYVDRSIPLASSILLEYNPYVKEIAELTSSYNQFNDHIRKLEKVHKVVIATAFFSECLSTNNFLVYCRSE